MACKCKRCGKLTECDFSVCMDCFLSMTDDEATKNLATGGRFYEKGDTFTVTCNKKERKLTKE